MKSTAMNKTKKVRVIPGYHLTLGITVTMLSLIVLIPLASVMVSTLKLRPAEFWSLITKPTVRHAFATSIGCSFIAALINSVFGVIIAWVLVRYEFPGKRILDGCIELPFALPTSVAGITLSKMYSENGILGAPLAKLGIRLSSVPCSRYSKNLTDSMKKQHLCLEPTGFRPSAECFFRR